MVDLKSQYNSTHVFHQYTLKIVPKLRISLIDFLKENKEATLANRAQPPRVPPIPHPALFLVLHRPSLPLVTFDNDALRKTLLSRDITTSTTTPSFIRSFYSARALHPSSHPSISSNHTNAKALLLYSISDLPSTSSYTELSDLPFIPLADSKSLGTFCALPKADSSHLVQLESMGFTKFLALHALRKFRNKLDPAIEWLFEVRRGCKR